MKNKTKKSLLAWLMSVVFVGVVYGMFWWGLQFGITTFPTLVSVLGWILTHCLAVVTRWRGW